MAKKKPARQKRTRIAKPNPDFETVEVEVEPQSIGPPCEQCGERVKFWWNPLGKRSCFVCNPPLLAKRLLQLKRNYLRSLNP